MITIEHIDHIAIAVTDLERSAAWYHDVLGLQRRHEDAWEGPPYMMCAGDTCVALFPTATDAPLPPPDNNTIAMRHFAFRATRANFERAQTELRARGIEVRFADHGVAHSIYFRDPDGHRLEITTYEVE